LALAPSDTKEAAVSVEGDLGGNWRDSCETEGRGKEEEEEAAAAAGAAEEEEEEDAAGTAADG
jgi:hypothetical protein